MFSLMDDFNADMEVIDRTGSVFLIYYKGENFN